jgi:hypothetical protein
MDYTKIFLILGFSIAIYIAFLFLGFLLRDKNLIAQNIKKEK